jgi:hypothetical protein
MSAVLVCPALNNIHLVSTGLGKAGLGLGLGLGHVGLGLGLGHGIGRHGLDNITAWIAELREGLAYSDRRAPSAFTPREKK